MQESTRAFFKRGGTACAAAALVLGSTFVTVPGATAAPATTPSPSVPAAPTAPVTDAPADGVLPGGLEEALERDLDMTKEEFDAAGELSQKALKAEAAVEKTDAEAEVSIKDGAIQIHTTTTGVDAEATEKKLSKELGTKVEVSVVKDEVKAQQVATSLEALAAEYISKFGADKLQSIMSNGSEFVIRTGERIENDANARTFFFKPSVIEAFEDRYSNVVVEAAQGPSTALASDAVLNGQGYLGTSGGGAAACSIGFNGFDVKGNPAVISAGHCALDGEVVQTSLSDPAAEPANGGPGFVETFPLGKFGFSQFGGENNSPITGKVEDGQIYNPGNEGTDIAVIDVTNDDLDLVPTVTAWDAEPNRQITSVGEAVIGAPVCRSGRTTGWDCDIINEIGFFYVAGHNYENDPTDVRGVKGFSSFGLVASPGDSGGTMISGTRAIGVVSSGTPGVVTNGTSLVDGLAHTDGYTVELAVNAPTLTSAENKGEVATGSTMSGTVSGDLAPATSVVVTVDGQEQTVPVKDGKWSFKAPSTPGEFTFTAQGKNGFSTSTTETYTLTAILAVPAISTPKDGDSLIRFVTSISGTGVAGATVELTGDITGEATVSDDGTWTHELDEALRYGQHSVTAVQTLSGATSKGVTSSFKVVPAKPVITSPEAGHEFSYDEGGPTTITGTGVESAAVLVTINGDLELKATVEEGKWGVEVPNKFDAGTHNITAVQTVSEMTSGAATVSITVLAAPEPEPTEPPSEPAPEPTDTPTTPAPGDNGTPAPGDNDDDGVPNESDDLPNTGSSSALMSIGAAGGVLLLAGAAFMLFRRRNLEG